MLVITHSIQSQDINLSANFAATSVDSIVRYSLQLSFLPAKFSDGASLLRAINPFIHYNTARQLHWWKIPANSMAELDEDLWNQDVVSTPLTDLTLLTQNLVL